MQIPENELLTGIKLCVERSQSLLDYALVLIERGTTNNGLGFYTFALEELGKTLILRKYYDDRYYDLPNKVYRAKNSKTKIVLVFLKLI